MSDQPSKFTSVAAGMSMVAMFLYILPLAVNYQLAVDLPNAMATSFSNLPTDVPPSPQLVPFNFGSWLFHSFPATGDETPEPQGDRHGVLAPLLSASTDMVANKTTYAYKTNIARRDADTSRTGEWDCGSMTREWSDELLMDVFLPTNRGAFAKTPVLFHVHGGAWRVGDKSVAGEG